MSRLDTLDYSADFLRGWPNDGALESSYPIAATVDLEAGDLVELNTSGELILNNAESSSAGIVVRGNIDDKSVQASGKAIVLWGGYIVRTTKIAAGIAGANPGTMVNADASGVFAAAAAGGVADATLGMVLESGTAKLNGVDTDYLVIVVR